MLSAVGLGKKFKSHALVFEPLGTAPAKSMARQPVRLVVSGTYFCCAGNL